jgi:putative Mg2+ transporter-C (MgtC) family protein
MMPSEFYAHHMIRFDRDAIKSEDELRRLIGQHGFTIANMSYRLIGLGKVFEYTMVIRSRDQQNAGALAKTLRQLPEVLEFRIAPT